MVKKKGNATFHDNMIELISFREATELYHGNNRPVYPLVFRVPDREFYELCIDLCNPISKLVIPQSFKADIMAIQYLRENNHHSNNIRKRKRKTHYTKGEYKKKLNAMNIEVISDMLGI
jgi:hypothetical protein